MITSLGGYTQQVLQDNECGYVCSSVADWAFALFEFSRADLEVCGLNARSLYASEYGFDNVYKSAITKISKLI